METVPAALRADRAFTIPAILLTLIGALARLMGPPAKVAFRAHIIPTKRGQSFVRPGRQKALRKPAHTHTMMRAKLWRQAVSADDGARFAQCAVG